MSQQRRDPCSWFHGAKPKTISSAGKVFRFAILLTFANQVGNLFRMCNGYSTLIQMECNKPCFLTFITDCKNLSPRYVCLKT